MSPFQFQNVVRRNESGGGEFRGCNGHARPKNQQAAQGSTQLTMKVARQPSSKEPFPIRIVTLVPSGTKPGSSNLTTPSDTMPGSSMIDTPGWDGLSLI